MTQKKIILGYNTPHCSEIPDVSGWHTGPGFGDILRGMLSLTEYAKGRNVEIEYCFTNHPISNWLKGTIERTSYPFLDFTTHVLKDWKPIYQAFEIVLQDTNILSCYIESTVIPFQATNVESLDYLKKEYFSESTIKAVRESLSFSDEIINYYDSVIQNLEIKNSYSVLHIRLTDKTFSDFDLGGLPISNIIKKIKDLDLDSKNTILISTNKNVLKLLKQKLKFKAREIDPIHLGMFNDDTEERSQRIKDTLLDFFILSKSSRIIQISDYPWGSGFSDTCALLYNIPIEKHLLSSD